jgi:hypothetical protein
MNLSDREYWKPSEAAAVLGRTAKYWANQFDAGSVRGYTDGHRRHLQAESCRALLDRLSTQRVVVADIERQKAEEKAEMRYWNRQRVERTA